MSYFSQCLPKIVNIRDGSGCSMTRATADAMTPDEFAALGDQEDLQRVYANAAMAEMRGVHLRYIDALLMGRLKYYGDKVNVKKIGGPQSIIEPFITERQRHVVNTGYFDIESGTSSGGYRWSITVKNTSYFAQTDNLRIDRYFVPGNTVVINHVSSSGASLSTKMKIISVTNATSGGVPKATVIIEPNVSSATFSGYTASQKAAYQPTGGLVLLGTNSVSDYEAWCNVFGVDNNLSLIHFWMQTSRKAHVVSEEYLKILEAPTMNEFFKVFDTLPWAEQVKQQDIAYRQQLATSFFWGQPINEYQDVNNWQGNLPEVTDIDDNSCVLEYKAEAEGVEYQLNRCGRVLDMAGQPLNFDTLEELLYQLKRHREMSSDTGEAVIDVDLQVDRVTANNIKSMFANYYKEKYGIQYTQEIGKGRNETFSQTSGLAYNSYDFDEAGVTLNVIADPFFADLRGSTSSGHRQASTYAFFLDYSDIDWGITKTSSRVNKYPNPEDIPSDYKCVIQRNVKTYQLYSQTWTAAVKRPDRHLIVKGFNADACPHKTYQSCDSYVYEG